MVESQFFNGAPFMLVGDFNADVTDIPTLSQALDLGTLVDVGANASQSGQGQTDYASTCFAQAMANGTRRDYVFTSPSLYQFVVDFKVQRDPALPVHAILGIDFNIPCSDPGKRVLQSVPSLAQAFTSHIRASHHIPALQPIPNTTMQEAKATLHSHIEASIAEARDALNNALVAKDTKALWIGLSRAAATGFKNYFRTLPGQQGVCQQAFA